VVKRDWAFHKDIWDVYASLHGREIVVCGRLLMSGCKFGYVDRVLQYRGFHASRKVKELKKKCDDELECQEIIFSDPRCPTDVSELRPVARANIFMMWANIAFNQSETELGCRFLKSAIQLNPSLLSGKPPLFINFLQDHCVDDESQDYKIMLDRIISQLRLEVPTKFPNYLWEISRGYFVRGVRALIWDRPNDAKRYFAKAAKHEIRFDERFFNQVAYELLGYELAHGKVAAFEKLLEFSSQLEKDLSKGIASWLKGNYWLNRAIREYHDGQFGAVPRSVFGAIANHPKYLTNRGILSILVKSIMVNIATAQ
jgi:hypothetical protein